MTLVKQIKSITANINNYPKSNLTDVQLITSEVSSAVPIKQLLMYPSTWFSSHWFFMKTCGIIFSPLFTEISLLDKYTFSRLFDLTPTTRRSQTFRRKIFISAQLSQWHQPRLTPRQVNNYFLLPITSLMWDSTVWLRKAYPLQSSLKKAKFDPFYFDGPRSSNVIRSLKKALNRRTSSTKNKNFMQASSTNRKLTRLTTSLFSVRLGASKELNKSKLDSKISRLLKKHKFKVLKRNHALFLRNFLPETRTKLKKLNFLSRRNSFIKFFFDSSSPKIRELKNIKTPSVTSTPRLTPRPFRSSFIKLFNFPLKGFTGSLLRSINFPRRGSMRHSQRNLSFLMKDVFFSKTRSFTASKSFTEDNSKGNSKLWKLDLGSESLSSQTAMVFKRWDLSKKLRRRKRRTKLVASKILKYAFSDFRVLPKKIQTKKLHFVSNPPLFEYKKIPSTLRTELAGASLSAIYRSILPKTTSQALNDDHRYSLMTTGLFISDFKLAAFLSRSCADSSRFSLDLLNGFVSNNCLFRAVLLKLISGEMNTSVKVLRLNNLRFGQHNFSGDLESSPNLKTFALTLSSIRKKKKFRLKSWKPSYRLLKLPSNLVRSSPVFLGAKNYSLILERTLKVSKKDRPRSLKLVLLKLKLKNRFRWRRVSRTKSHFRIFSNYNKAPKSYRLLPNPENLDLILRNTHHVRLSKFMRRNNTRLRTQPLKKFVVNWWSVLKKSFLHGNYYTLEFFKSFDVLSSTNGILNNKLPRLTAAPLYCYSTKLNRKKQAMLNSHRSQSFYSQNTKFLLPQTHPSFQHPSFFMAQFLTTLKNLPFVRSRVFNSFTYTAPFDFVDFKRLKKSVFKRLLYQKTRINFLKTRNPNRLDTTLLNKRYVPAQVSNNPYTSYIQKFGKLFFSMSLSKHRTFGHNHRFYRLFKEMHTFSEQRRQPFIRKTRFKPGYPRIWRTERSILKETLGLTHRYQYRLTPKVQRLYWLYRQNSISNRYSNSYTKHHVLKLSHALMLGRLAFDEYSANFLINNEYVYLNGQLTLSGKIGIFVNDFIQLLINTRFYVVYKWLRGSAIFRFKSWMRKFYKTYRIKRQMFKDFTFRALPDAVMGLQNSWFDVPKRFEVDYFTLSIFVLTDFQADMVQYPYKANEFNLYALNMYNWKYLT